MLLLTSRDLKQGSLPLENGLNNCAKFQELLWALAEEAHMEDVEEFLACAKPEPHTLLCSFYMDQSAQWRT